MSQSRATPHKPAQRLRHALAALALIPALAACADETISGFADTNATYVLTEIDGAPFAPRATIAFPAKGEVTGQAPCNAYSAMQSAPYPWFELGPIAATKRACLHMDGEAQFFTALEAMRFAEVQGPVLILSGEDGTEMIFRTE